MTHVMGESESNFLPLKNSYKGVGLPQDLKLPGHLDMCSVNSNKSIHVKE